MSDVISDYQRWKQQGDDLRQKAKVAMEVRFRDALLEAARIALDYRADFGKVLKPPPAITAFRYKSAAKPKVTKKVSKPSARNEDSNPKLVALDKKLAGAKKKLDEARAAGKPTQTLEDKIYEIEDDIRLAGGND